nr:hypothetical protein HK105_006102 [Polyrhizophydium stewartii]
MPKSPAGPRPVVQRREQGIDTDPQQGVASPTSGSEDGGGDGLTFEDVSGVSLGPGDRIPLPIPGQGQDGGAERRRTRLEEQYAGIRQLAGSPDLETLMRVVTLGAQAESDADQLVGFLMEEDAKYMDLVVPFVARLALELADLFPLGLARLPRGVNRSVTLTQRQIASLLAHGFFCTFDHRRRPAFYPFINFDMLYSGHPDRPSSTKYRAKLKFIFHYFDCCIPDHLVPDWAQLGTLPLCDVTFSQKNIEDLRDTTQVDFANKFIGGGVLGSGFVQEEILFMVMPELIAACAIAERLDPNEALFMIGAQRYSDYSGYSGSTRWAGPHNDLLPV